MTITVTAVLGLVFVLLAALSTYLMFQFWGYEYDKDRRKSACPQWKMNIHRGVGYAYGIIYLIMMWHMVPRLWHYQIELPARTVAHIMLGLTIGVILIVKISILRWFRHFEEWMPVLGVGLLLCSVLLVSLSLPFVAREYALASGGANGGAFSEANRGRVRQLLATAGLPEGTDLDKLTTEKSLHGGRRVLLDECTFCHDLKTAITRPRTPEDWARTVRRMAEKPTLGPVISEDSAAKVTAYLVAITPELQQSAKAKRADDEEHLEAMRALEEMEAGNGSGGGEAMAEGGETSGGGEASEGGGGQADAGPVATGETPSQPNRADAGPATASTAPPARSRKPAIDLGRAKATFERVCGQCHPVSDVDDEPPRTRKAIDALIARMIDNGLEAKKAELSQVRAYLRATYAR